MTLVAAGGICPVRTALVEKLLAREEKLMFVFKRCFKLFSATIESVEALANFGFMPDSHRTTVDATKAKFDEVAVEACSKNVSDTDLLKISRNAPKHFTPPEKVRYMEIMTASISEDSQRGLYLYLKFIPF